MAMTDTTDRTPRERRLNRVYRTRDGREVKQIDENCVAVIITPAKADVNERMEMDLVGLFPSDPGSCMGIAAAALGVTTSVSNATAAAGSEPISKQFELMRERWSTITEGEWRSDREGGPRTRALAEAYVDMLVAQKYQVPEDFVEVIQGKIASGELDRKRLQDNPTFKAYYAAAELRRATERQRKAEEEARASGGDLGSILVEGLTR